VDSEEEVHVAMTDLLRDKKVANATHNIAAYRIVGPDGRLVHTEPRLLLSPLSEQAMQVVCLLTRMFQSRSRSEMTMARLVRPPLPNT
jgi:hypothetical protein